MLWDAEAFSIVIFVILGMPCCLPHQCNTGIVSSGLTGLFTHVEPNAGRTWFAITIVDWDIRDGGQSLESPGLRKRTSGSRTVNPMESQGSNDPQNDEFYLQISRCRD
ncbi:hypothetical protein BDV12DRAFT_68464 [Aspergillus spectabilis]